MKALKRQVDEAEEEIERLDGLRKKAQRELEEQHEVNEQLQARIKALEKDSWYGCSPALLPRVVGREGAGLCGADLEGEDGLSQATCHSWLEARVMMTF